MTRESNYGEEWVRSLRENPHGARHGEAPCIRCGTVTSRRAVLSVGRRNMTGHAPDAGKNSFLPELAPWCESCEARRVQQQYERIAANEQVWPHLRAEARAWLVQQENYAAPRL